MHLDPLLPMFAGITLITLIVSIILKRCNQPYIIAYLIVGGILGPHGMGFISNDNAIIQLGSMGVVILMFFIGMEVSPKHLAANWKITVIGTLFQIVLNISIVFILGMFLDWSINLIILMGFVISISSTVVVIQLLRDWQELNTRIGQDVLGMLLVQDITLVPMVIILGAFNNNNLNIQDLFLQIVGAILIVTSVIWMSKKEKLTWKWMKYFASDNDLQVFAALGICTGFALITSLMQLSTALGAFIAGIFVSRFAETSWVGHSLESLKVLFVTLFFLSIGMLIDFNFLVDNLYEILWLTLIILFVNTLVTALTMRFFGYNWQSSIYEGSLLSQIGEFSFIFAAIGLNSNIIIMHSYQMTISVIAVTMLLSPLFIFFIRRNLFLMILIESLSNLRWGNIFLKTR